MAQSVVINEIVYSSVPAIEVPKSNGGTAKFYDTSDANLASADLPVGKKGYGSNGLVNGSMADNGDTSGTISTKSGTVSIPAGKTSGGTVSINENAVSDLVPSNLLKGKSVLGVEGQLALPSISQDSTTKVLSIS